MIKVAMSAKALKELKLHRVYDTRTSRYIVDEDKIYRISLEALDTSAALADACDINPDGWKRVCLVVDGKELEYV